ncbi:hypothetical protein Nos7524_4441 [Nostoc sp. PCC 7524]|uniref:hypothetical protein n=1 Tax=Nostoc sp. (strain ATCC 29411 / PCC 7524) TaxID=28072 RepID=UPI00029ECDA4|nr:hypothetical protein [Nostoc sp. PCC 7524]AFY50199.1 hypothetical protein Nos7524_4441 [Nostoc sp. PCC 7524]
MNIIICPGIHETDLTESFISGWLSPSIDNLKSSSSSTLQEAKATSLQSPIPSPQSPIPSPQSPIPSPENILVAPVPGILALSSLHILQFLHDRLHHRLESPVIFISFSAGVVGAIAAAWQWQLLGGDVKAFIAIDGWGVPLWGKFPIHRLSHDYFTHWSSSLLGSGQDNFYAEPAVDHLTMWRSPHSVQGWWVDSSQGEITTPKTRLTAAEFLHLLLKHYEEK